MAARIVWTESALQDLQELVDFLEPHENPQAADFLERLLLAPERLQENPRQGRMVPEEAADSIRELLVGRYRLIYQLGPDRISILRILGQAQDFRREWKRPPGSL